MTPPCPCGSGRDLEACCGRYHAGARPPTAESLMRARYAAYALGRYAFLSGTVTPELGDGFRTADLAASARGLTWTGLEVLATDAGGPADATGTVSFAAHYVHDGKAGAQREVSSFVRGADGEWLYAGGTLGTVPSPSKVGRNDPCPCGSGRKYKKCCGA